MVASSQCVTLLRLLILRRAPRSRPVATHRSLLLIAALCLLFAPALSAQSPIPVVDVTHIHGPKLLDSTWLVQAGDNPAYASAAFDDSHWIHFDPSSPINVIYGKQRPSVIWYRQHITVDSAEKDLALSEWQIARAFEIYVNGERIIASGRIDPFRPYTLTARPVGRIPQRMVESGSLVIAIRVYISPSEWGNGQNPGYYANNLSIGQYDTLARDNWLSIIGANTLQWLDRFLLACLGLVAFVLFAAQRRQKSCQEAI